MSEYPHTVDSVARELGRFEMHLSPIGRPIALPYGIDTFSALGLSTAHSLHAFVGEGSIGPRAETLEKFGRREEKHWLLDPPDESNRALWRRFLRTDTPLVAEAPNDLDWVSRLVRALWRPIIYYTGAAILSEGAVSFCRDYLAKKDGLLIVTSTADEALTLFGRGALFERALDASTLKAPEVWGYTDKQRADILRGALRLFKPRLL